MRIGVVRVVVLLVFAIGSWTAQAQSVGAFEPGGPWKDIFGAGSGLDDERDDEGDDEGNDEGDDCPEFPSPVPASGQTECYGTYLPVDCAGTGQDGETQVGVSVDPRFTDNGDGTVTDNLTGVVWLKHAGCFGFQTWHTALSLVAALSDGSCGLGDGSVPGDWRLPNVRELQSVIDFGRLSPTLAAGHPFYFVKNAVYWSSTTSTVFSNVAWVVSLGVGSSNFISKDAGGTVWAVRHRP